MGGMVEAWGIGGYKVDGVEIKIPYPCEMRSVVRGMVGMAY